MGENDVREERACARRLAVSTRRKQAVVRNTHDVGDRSHDPLEMIWLSPSGDRGRRCNPQGRQKMNP